MPQRTVDSPIGPIRLTSREGLLTGLCINAPAAADIAGDDDLLDQTTLQLSEYFGGSRTRFDLPLAPLKSARGAALRAAISGIGYGERLSYGALARIAASGPRAIGQACARNTLPIVVPCHRIVASDGLGHYSGGNGVATKSWLLAHEAKHG